jgi:hypothetical protein
MSWRKLPRYRWSKDGQWFGIHLRYSPTRTPEFIKELKGTVAPRCYWYDPETWTWWVVAKLAEVAVEIAGKHFGFVCARLPPPPEPAPAPESQADPLLADPWTTPWAALRVLPGAPREVVDAAYRALVKLHHPDLNGGDGEQMKRINDARDRVFALEGWR